MSDLLYYYADHSGRAVGPLKLDQIRQFVTAGVISSDVMVCEAGGEHWVSLTNFSAATLKGSVDRPTNAGAFVNRIDPSKSATRLTWHFIHALNAAVVSNAMTTWESVTFFEETPGKFDEYAHSIALIAFLWSFAALAVFIYQSLRLLPPQHRFTSPVKAAGLFLIPFFSTYWLFRVYTGLARGVQGWRNSQAATIQGRFRHLRIFVPLAISAAVVSAAKDVSGLLQSVYLFVEPVSSEARGVFFLLSMGDALVYTIIFAFLRVVLRSMRELIDPGREERIEKEPRPFFRPEYLEVGITGAFIGLVALIWYRGS